MAKRILIIDDDAELCEELAEILRGEDYAVETASDGFQGQELVRRAGYDIVILDYKMPGLNGIDVLKFIRDNNIKTKVFLSSGRPFIVKVLKSENVLSLVTAIIIKPFDIKILLKKLKSV